MLPSGDRWSKRKGLERNRLSKSSDGLSAAQEAESFVAGNDKDEKVKHLRSHWRGGRFDGTFVGGRKNASRSRRRLREGRSDPVKCP